MNITSICIEIYGIAAKVLTFLDGKKTTIGALFFVIKDVIITPYYLQFHGSVPPQLDFWLGVTATLLTLAGVTHKAVKGIQARRLAKALKESNA